MPFTITGEVSGAIDVKRFYLPGIVARDECPKCKRTLEWEGDSNYLSYPNTREQTAIYFYCEDCNEDWKQPVQLRIRLEVL